MPSPASSTLERAADLLHVATMAVQADDQEGVVALLEQVRELEPHLDAGVAQRVETAYRWASSVTW